MRVLRFDFVTPGQLQALGWPVDGFMADFGEGEPNDMPPSFRLFKSFFASAFFFTLMVALHQVSPFFSTSATDLRLHNNFSCVWLETVAMAFALAAQQLGVPDNFVAFARSGCISAAKHSRLFWAGDQLISWDSRDGIGSALTAVTPPSFSFHHQPRHQEVL